MALKEFLKELRIKKAVGGGVVEGCCRKNNANGKSVAVKNAPTLSPTLSPTVKIVEIAKL